MGRGSFLELASEEIKAPASCHKHKLGCGCIDVLDWGRQTAACMLMVVHETIWWETWTQISTQSIEVLTALLEPTVQEKATDIPAPRPPKLSAEFKVNPWDAGSATGGWLLPSISGQVQLLSFLFVCQPTNICAGSYVFLFILHLGDKNGPPQ